MSQQRKRLIRELRARCLEMEATVTRKMEENLRLQERHIQLQEAALARELADPQQFPLGQQRAVQLQIFKARHAAAELELAQRAQSLASEQDAQDRGEE